LANSIWQTKNKFGKKRTNFSLKLAVLIVGEIEQQIFCQTLCAGKFLLGKKVW